MLYYIIRQRDWVMEYLQYDDVMAWNILVLSGEYIIWHHNSMLQNWNGKYIYGTYIFKMNISILIL